jgi:hypothetical protein
MSFAPNRNLGAEIERAAEFQAAMRARAEMVKAEADRIGKEIKMPWLPRKGAGGTFVVAQQGDMTAVVCTDYGGHWAEWGNVHMAPAAPLRRAARAAGLTLK